ncbi:Gfo/Idh/MocA family oxidoreductase [Herbaspirillum sp.]|uniref:Gfo/Idh/MocA family protein n=1 Tax=Herbaspirillum sp. TaxID=1890675 RepID=UPI0031DBC5A5
MLKTAIIGCGRMGAEPSARLSGKVPAGWLPVSHAESILQVPSLKLSALVEPNPSRLAWAGNQYLVGNLFSDYRDLFAQEKIDVVSVATRTPQKRDILLSAISAGVKGIYVEKPLANSLEVAAEILAAAESAGVKLSYGVNRRYHAIYRKAREIIRSGEIGKLEKISIEFGKSPLLWTHPHSMDIMLFLSGQTPQSATAEFAQESFAQKDHHRIDSDPVVLSAHFDFSDGMIGVISNEAGTNVKVNGEKGSLEISSNGELLRVEVGSKNYSIKLNTNERSATVVAFDELSQRISGHAVESISINEISLGMKMLLGCVYSHRQGNSKITLNDIPQELEVTGRFGEMFA